MNAVGSGARGELPEALVELESELREFLQLGPVEQISDVRTASHVNLDDAVRLLQMQSPSTTIADGLAGNVRAGTPLSGRSSGGRAVDARTGEGGRLNVELLTDTGRALSYDVDALNEKVNPARVMDRRVSAVKGRIANLKDRVMGTAQDTTSSAQGEVSITTGSVQNAASSAADTVQSAAASAASAVQQAPDAVIRLAQGNPLATGLIAFGVGWLVSSLLPASEKERQLAQEAERAFQEHKDTLLEPAKQVAQETVEQLKPAAQEAVEEVKSTAQDAAETVKEEGRAAAQDVQGQAQSYTETAGRPA